MPSGFALDISGIPGVAKALQSIEKNATQGLEDELKASVMKIASDAKRRAPKNLGTLAQGIGFAGNGLTWDTFATASYAAYMEFGTGGRVKIPVGFEQYAAQFKGGKGGTFKDMVLAIAQWVKRKGITGTYSVKTQKRTGNKATRQSQDMQAAYAIAISILKKGIKPQPFMIPAYETEKPKLIARLKKTFS